MIIIDDDTTIYSHKGCIQRNKKEYEILPPHQPHLLTKNLKWFFLPQNETLNTPHKVYKYFKSIVEYLLYTVHGKCTTVVVHREIKSYVQLFHLEEQTRTIPRRFIPHSH